MTNWTDAIADYVLSMRDADRSEQTIQLRRYHLSRLAMAMRPTQPWDVTEDDLIAWTGAQQWATETRRSMRATLRGFYGRAHLRGLIESNPATGMVKIRPAQPRPKPTPETAYLAALAAGDARERLALRLGGEAGLRRGEIVRVHSRDLFEDLDGWSLLVHGKGNRQRVVPLLDDLASAVRVMCQLNGGWAFPGQVDGHLSPHYLGKRLSRLLPEGVSTHSLRHRFATRTYAVDTDLVTVQELLGHASPETTRRYVKVPNGALRRTVVAAAGAGPGARGGTDAAAA